MSAVVISVGSNLNLLYYKMEFMQRLHSNWQHTNSDRKVTAWFFDAYHHLNSGIFFFKLSLEVYWMSIRYIVLQIKICRYGTSPTPKFLSYNKYVRSVVVIYLCCWYLVNTLKLYVCGVRVNISVYALYNFTSRMASYKL